MAAAPSRLKLCNFRSDLPSSKQTAFSHTRLHWLTPRVCFPLYNRQVLQQSSFIEPILAVLQPTLILIVKFEVMRNRPWLCLFWSILFLNQFVHLWPAHVPFQPPRTLWLICCWMACASRSRAIKLFAMKISNCRPGTTRTLLKGNEIA